MRLGEAAIIANIFGRSITVFSKRNKKDDIRLYVQNHVNEAKSFENIFIAARELNQSFKTHSYKKEAFSLVPRHGMYDGSASPEAAIAKQETLCADTIIKQVQYLFSKNSIFLAGNNNALIQILTTYMHRWWADKINPKIAEKILIKPGSKDIEDQERTNNEKLRRLCQLYSEVEVWSPYEYNPCANELTELITEINSPRKITNSTEALMEYERSISQLKVYDYSHCLRQIKILSQKTDTLLTDSFEERIHLLKEQIPLDEMQYEFDKKISGLIPIRAGYGTTFKNPSDTELARLILQQQKFTWYFNSDGSIIASDKTTELFYSIKDLATAMRKAEFITDDISTQSSSVSWSNIPSTERAFQAKLT